MGFNSVILVLNDRLGEIERAPDHFVQGMVGAIHKAAGYNDLRGTDFYVGQSAVVSVAHADATQLVAVGGNCSTVLGHFWGHEHYTAEGQERLLREWANRMGFRLARKPKGK